MSLAIHEVEKKLRDVSDEKAHHILRELIYLLHVKNILTADEIDELVDSSI